ncbi:MAG: carbon-nitrogen hydrolase family protein [Promethearchaeota archaeon]
MSSQDNFTLAAFQLQPSKTISTTITAINTLTVSLTSQDIIPNCIVLPEYIFGTLRDWKDKEKEREEKSNKIINAMSELCKQHHVAMVAGSIPHKTLADQWRNRSYIFSADGNLVGSYDKQRPFRSEKFMGLEPGNHTPIFEFSKLRLSVLICADLWLPEIIYAIRGKIDFIAVPTMTTVLNKNQIAYGRWNWHSLVAVRAKEYAVPIVSADHAPWEYVPGVYTCGASCIADSSYRFSDEEGPYTQALKVPQQKPQTAVVSTISRKAVRAYQGYRKDVGLLE